ncbi:Ig-like domain-containing protein [Ruminococcus bicirculans (ex Wegman et al. 2014)]|uniref:Ig-like domain-containing protein n=1 Tax=Ruminococcus bicirculans (ex Wegman et al. 2014) TaxID=1160721 RepID=UPI00189C2763|nr:Ig-like domain-containing protein [Ruminococcus bicirculans (ex Wegman et al. 2014)]
MKVVSPKASSKIYKIFTIVTAVLAVLFLTSNSWIASLTYKSKSNGYNKTMSLNGYNIKVTDAAYYDNVCEFVIKCRLSGSDTGATYPEVTAVNFDDDLTDHKFTAGNKYDDYSRKITVKNPPSNFKIMRVVIKTSMPDTKYDDAYDEFGEKIPAHTEKGKTITLRVTIDRKDMQTHAVKIVPGYSEESSNANTTSGLYNSETSKITSQQAVAVTTQATAPTTHDLSEKAAEASQTSRTTTEKRQPATAEMNTKPAETRDYNEPAYAPPQTTAATHNEPAQAETTTTQARVYSIKLATEFEYNDVQIKVGEHTQLRAEVKPDNAVNKNVKWESNRPEIATVDSNGRVTAVAKGKAIISAVTEDKGLQASCMVTVEE